jgi:signal transduction histidine kinase/streptogramin lyase
MRDKSGGLWVGTETNGLFHSHGNHTDHISVEDGLSGVQVNDIFEDREGNIWVSTASGLDEFRRLSISSFGLKEGVASDESDSILARKNGEVWIGGLHGLTIISHESVRRIQRASGLPDEQVTSMFEASDGTVWLGVGDRLAHYSNGVFLIAHRESGEYFGPIVDFAEDYDGTIILVHTVQHKPSVLRGGANEPFSEMPLPGVDRPLHVARDGSGGFWISTSDAKLFHRVGGTVSEVRMPSSLGRIRAMASDADGSMWFASRSGLFRLVGETWQSLSTDQGLPCADVESVIFDAGHRLWAHLQCGYASIDAQVLEAWKQDTSKKISATLLDASDGAQPGLTPFMPDASLSPDGTLWFAPASIAKAIRPSQLQRNTVPPPVHIEGLLVDRKPISASANITLPSLSREIEIRYSAETYTLPKKVNFKYQLKGVDNGFQDVAGRRSAFYSNLGPGNYTFQVLAANNDGLWNADGATVNFIIPPQFYQTTWFKAVTAAFLLLLLRLAYLYRLRFLASEMEGKVLAGLAERDRIARELHDTLWQSLQAIVLRFQSIANAPETSDPIRESLLDAIKKADVVLQEVRDRVMDLRDHAEPAESFSEFLSRSFEEFPKSAGQIEFHIEVSGVPRPLLELVREEIRAIARESIINSLQHANASHIYCELRYSRRAFEFICRDDGRGIPDEILREGRRAGHWGLIGIHERAAKIGGRMSIDSSSTGTTVHVIVYGTLAYPVTTRKKWRFWLR